jgi:Protein of unknown function (DUF2971)
MTAVDSLYHYCKAETFVSMIRSRSLWLSSLSLSNDTMEGRLVKTTIMRLAERDGLEPRARERLQESLAFTERAFDGLGFCLSEHGDLLSQWRGYAEDARGVAVGFSRAYLESLADSTRGGERSGFAMYKVEYESDAQEAEVRPTYRELRKLIDAGAFKTRGISSLLDVRTPDQIAADDRKTKEVHTALVFKLLELFPKLYKLKASAFREEREWRLVSMHIANGSDECLFRASAGRIIPYRSFELLPQSAPPFSEIILGPRHETPPSVIQSMLKQTGFGEVDVRRSEATYR